MHIKIVRGNLFSADPDSYLAHCVSRCFALDTGIAVEFEKQFDLRRHLKQMLPTGKQHEAILVGNVFNLVAKELYWKKPTYGSVRTALIDMSNQRELLGIKKLAIPKIASGLDRLEWPKVLNIIEDVFQDTNIDIRIYRQG